MGRVGFPGEPAPRNQRDIHHDQDSFVADAVKHRWRPSLAAFRKVDFLALEQFFHWMPPPAKQTPDVDKIAPTSRFRQRLRRKMPLKIAKQREIRAAAAS